jgi:hypothetical protein
VLVYSAGTESRSARHTCICVPAMYPAKLDRCCSPRRRVLRPITVTLIGACISEASVSPALVQCKFQHGNVFVCVRQRTLVSSLLSHVRPKRRRRAGPPGHARKLHATRSPLSPGLRITSHHSRYYSSAVFKKPRRLKNRLLPVFEKISQIR